MNSMSQRKLEFVVDAKLSHLGIPLASAQISGLDNARCGPPPPAASELQWSHFSPAFIESDPILAGYRALHTAVGRSNKRFVSSTEAMIRSYLRVQSLAQVNPAVDIYNRLSLETLLSIGAHDVAKIDGDVFFRETDGSERFVALGHDPRHPREPGESVKPAPISAGEYGYADSANDMLCRMECRQADKSKLDALSTNCVFIVQGNANTPEADVQRTLDTLVERVLAHCGGRARDLHRAVD